MLPPCDLRARRPEENGPANQSKDANLCKCLVVFLAMAIHNLIDCGVEPGAADTTDAIQDIINAAQIGDTVYVPTGTFNIDATKSLNLRTGIGLVVSVG